MSSEQRAGYTSWHRTIWGMELRQILTHAGERDLLFIERFATDRALAEQAIAAAVMHALRAIAWEIAGHVQVFPGGALPGSAPWVR